MGGKPGILANFMKTEYYSGRGYLEVDIDISTSGLAKRVSGHHPVVVACPMMTFSKSEASHSTEACPLPQVMGVVKKVARQVVIDLGFTIQVEEAHDQPLLALA